MRKQVAYDYRLLQVSATDPTASRKALSDLVNGYLTNGWQILNTETVHQEANTAFIAFHFVQYEDEPVASKSK